MAVGCAGPARAEPTKSYWDNLRVASEVSRERFSEVMTTCREAELLAPPESRRGEVLEQIGGEFDALLQHDANIPVYYTTCAQTLLAIDPTQTAKAVELAHAAIQISADFVPGHLLLADVAVRQQKPAEALEHLSRATLALKSLNDGVALGQSPLKGPVVLFGLFTLRQAEVETGVLTRRQKADLMLGMHLIDNEWSVLGSGTLEPGAGNAANLDAESVLKRLAARIALLELQARREANASAQELDALEQSLRTFDANYVPLQLYRAQQALRAGQTNEAVALYSFYVGPKSNAKSPLSIYPPLLLASIDANLACLQQSPAATPTQRDAWTQNILHHLATLEKDRPWFKLLSSYHRIRLELVLARLNRSNDFYTSAIASLKMLSDAKFVGPEETSLTQAQINALDPLVLQAQAALKVTK